MKWYTAITVAVVLALAGGCTGVEVTDGDRGLAFQNSDAASLIQGMPESPIAVKQIAADIKLNSDQLTKNFGPPKDKTVLKPYSAAASNDLRKRSEQEHKDAAGKWAMLIAAGGTALTLLGWFARSSGLLGSIPIIGDLLAKVSPRLANGAMINEQIALGLQTAMDKGRDYYDKQAAVLKAKLEASPLPADAKSAIAAQLPTGEKLVELVKSEMGKLGVLPANTKLYESNDTGVPA